MTIITIIIYGLGFLSTLLINFLFFTDRSLLSKNCINSNKMSYLNSIYLLLRDLQTVARDADCLLAVNKSIGQAINLF